MCESVQQLALSSTKAATNLTWFICRVHFHRTINVEIIRLFSSNKKKFFINLKHGNRICVRKFASVPRFIFSRFLWHREKFIERNVHHFILWNIHLIKRRKCWLNLIYLFIAREWIDQHLLPHLAIVSVEAFCLSQTEQIRWVDGIIKR